MSDQDRFRNLFNENHRAVLAYALRRTTDPADAADVVGDVFTVVWRRISEVPKDPEARLWIFGVARMSLKNQQRGSLRRTRLSERMATVLRQELQTDPAESIVINAAIASAMKSLRPAELEVMQLTAWEGLEPKEIAHILDIPAITVRTRIFRARDHLKKALLEQELVARSSKDEERQGFSGHELSDDLTSGHVLKEEI